MNQRTQITTELLGKPVHVEIDRPIGCRHGNLVYPVNYGFIPGMMAGDGEEQDAYILGVSEPLSSFDGQVIAIIRRHDDCEDKLVVAPDGMRFHQAQIMEAVHFQEQFFDCSIEPLFHKSCGVIPFRATGNEREYLVLLQAGGSWSFPKGHMEAFETETQTALRELFEEAGLEATLIPDTRVVSEYAISSSARKQLVLFLGQVQGSLRLRETEISDYRWVNASELQQYLQPDIYTACATLLR